MVPGLVGIVFQLRIEQAIIDILVGIAELKTRLELIVLVKLARDIKFPGVGRDRAGVARVAEPDPKPDIPQSGRRIRFREEPEGCFIDVIAIAEFIDLAGVPQPARIGIVLGTEHAQTGFIVGGGAEGMRQLGVCGIVIGIGRAPVVGGENACIDVARAACAADHRPHIVRGLDNPGEAAVVRVRAARPPHPSFNVQLHRGGDVRGHFHGPAVITPCVVREGNQIHALLFLERGEEAEITQLFADKRHGAAKRQIDVVVRIVDFRLPAILPEEEALHRLGRKFCCRPDALCGKGIPAFE